MIMFVPGETISHKFFIPVVQGDVVKLNVSYRQEGRIVLVKQVYPGSVTNDSSGVGSSFVVTLSQEESLLFQNNKSYTVQVNMLLKDNVRCASVEMNGANGVQHIREVVN